MEGILLLHRVGFCDDGAIASSLIAGVVSLNAVAPVRWSPMLSRSCKCRCDQSVVLFPPVVLYRRVQRLRAGPLAENLPLTSTSRGEQMNPSSITPPPLLNASNVENKRPV